MLWQDQNRESLWQVLSSKERKKKDTITLEMKTGCRDFKNFFEIKKLLHAILQLYSDDFKNPDHEEWLSRKM